MADFDPDAYLAKRPEEGTFDPDAYLGIKRKPAGFSPTDTALSFGQGIIGAGKSLTDVFGAGNAASEALGRGQEYLGKQITPERQAEIAARQGQIKAAEGTGFMNEVGAELGAIKDAPIQATAQALGSVVPFLATSVVGGAARLLPATVRLINTIVGAAQGAGSIKGSIYDTVKDKLVESGMPEAKAKEQAALAQNYNSKNALDIAAGTALGAVGARIGVENQLIKGAAEKTPAKLLPRVGKAALEEAPMEGLQGGQEKTAQNRALQKEGFDTPTFKGVAGRAAGDAALGALAAGAVGATHGPSAPKPAPQTAPVEAASAAPTAQPAPVTATPSANYADVFEQKINLEQGPQTPETAARIAELDKQLETLSTEAESAPVEEAPPAAPVTPPAAPVEDAPAAPTTAAPTPAAPVTPATPAPTEATSAPTESPPSHLQPITAEEVAALGSSMAKKNRQWLTDNVQGKTPVEVQAMVQADPTLLTFNKGIKNALGEIVQIVELENRNASPTQLEVQPTVRARGREPSVGVPVQPTSDTTEQAGATAPTGEPTEPVGQRLVSPEQPTSAGTAAEGSQPGALAEVTLPPAPQSPDDLFKPQAPVGKKSAAPTVTPKPKATAPATPAPVTPKLTEPRVEPTADDTDEIEALDAALNKYNNPENDKNVTTLKQLATFIKGKAESKIASKAVRQHAQAMVDDQILDEHLTYTLASTENAEDRPLPENVVGHIERGSVIQAMSALATTLEQGSIERAVAQRLSRLLGNTDIKIVSDLKGSKGQAVRGLATSNGDSIQLDRKRGMNVETFLHEGVHAASENVIQQDPKTWTPQQAAAVDELKALWEAAKRDKSITLSKPAQENLSEFITEAMTNKDLQVQLRAKPWKMKNAWDWFKRNMLKAVGVEHPKSMQDSVIAAMDSIFEAVPEYAHKYGPRSENFKKWFGNSDVVDKNGQPLVMYHGTDKDFDSFNTMAGVGKGKALGPGAYFSPSAERASAYASEKSGANIVPVYLSIKNPLITDAFTYPYLGHISEKENLNLRKEGYDGIILFGTDGNILEAVAFYPEQVKSATGNSGAYDATKPSMLEMATPTQDPELTDIYKRMGRELTEPDNRSYVDQAKEVLQGAADKLKPKNGKGPIQRIVDSAADMLDAGEPLMRGIRAEIRATLPENEANAAVTALSMSQASHDSGLATTALLDGGIGYDAKTSKFKTEDSKYNLKALGAAYKKMMEAHGLTLAKAREITSDALESKRMVALINMRDRLLAQATQLEADGKKKAAKTLRDKAGGYTFHMELDEAKAGMELYAKYPEIQEIDDIKQGMRKWLRTFLEDTGVWSPETAQWMLDNAEWVPFQREATEEETDKVGFTEYIRGLQAKAKEHRFKGSYRAVHDVMDNFENWAAYSVSRGIKNQKSTELAQAAVKYLPKTEAKAVLNADPKASDRTVSYLEKGSPKYVEFDSAAKAQLFKGSPLMAKSGLPIIGGMIDSMNSVFRGAIVNFPLFPVYQLAMDSISATYLSGLKPRYAFQIPLKAVSEAVKTLRGTSEAYKELRKFGAVGVHDYDATLSRTNADVEAGLKSLGNWGKYKSIMHNINLASDNSVRQAVYLAAKDSGLSDAAAVEKAFEIINFRTRVGNQQLAAAARNVVFLNSFYAASRVALKVLSSEGISPTERKQARNTLISNLAWIAGASALLAMANTGDDDYEKMSRQEQAGKLTAPGLHGWGIPLRPDVFMLVKLLSETLVRQFSDKYADDPAKLRATLADGIANAMFSGPIPISQPIKVGLELATNHDFFTGRAIVGSGLEKREGAAQFSSGTSELAKGIGKGTKNLAEMVGLENYFRGASPVKVDHFIQGMMGMYGGAVIMVTNSLLSNRPSQSTQDAIASLPGMGRVGVKEFDNQTKTDFYDLASRVSEAVATANSIKLPGQGEEYRAYREAHKHLMKYQGYVQNIETQLGVLRKQITIITENKTMSSDEKRDKIHDIKMREQRMLANQANYIKKARTEALNTPAKP